MTEVKKSLVAIAKAVAVYLMIHVWMLALGWIFDKQASSGQVAVAVALMALYTAYLNQGERQ